MMLKTDKVTLRPLKNEDSATLYDWINHREQVLWNAPYCPVAELSHESWFSRIVNNKDNVIFGIVLNEADKLIGSCQLHSIHPVHRSAELQIRIGEVSERGKGYGTDAVRLLQQFAFEDLNLHRVFLTVKANNIAALKIYEKCGFKHEGVQRRAAFIDGKYHDLVMMSILREEFS